MKWISAQRCKVLSFLKSSSSKVVTEEKREGEEKERERRGEKEKTSLLRETLESSFNALNGTFDDFMNNKPLTTINFCTAGR